MNFALELTAYLLPFLPVPWPNRLVFPFLQFAERKYIFWDFSYIARKLCLPKMVFALTLKCNKFFLQCVHFNNGLFYQFTFSWNRTKEQWIYLSGPSQFAQFKQRVCKIPVIACKIWTYQNILPFATAIVAPGSTYCNSIIGDFKFVILLIESIESDWGELI